MPLVLKPHTATRSAAADSVGADAAVKGVTRSGSSTVTGQLVRLTAVQAVEEFGNYTEISGKWLQDIDALTLAVGDHITIGSEVYLVKTDKTLHNSLAPVDYEVYGIFKVDA